MNLTEADISDMLPSGRQTTFYNRVSWAKTYLQRAGLVETLQRGKYITEIHCVRPVFKEEFPGRFPYDIMNF